MLKERWRYGIIGIACALALFFLYLLFRFGQVLFAIFIPFFWRLLSPIS